MDRAEFAARIDHTVLGPETTWADVETVLDAALEHGMNACVPPAYVERAGAYVPTVTVVTVCGFPHGQAAPETKAFEAERAWRDGAEEVDVVVNVGRLHAGETDAVTEELEGVVASVPLPVKVIVEAPLLAEDDLRTACELAEAAGADFVKTATGFSIGGATVEDVRVMAEYLPVKASGGVGSFEEAVEFLEAGAARIGASAGVEIVEAFDPERLDEFDPEHLDEFDPERPDEFDPERPEAHDDEHLETEGAPGAAEADDHDREEDDSSRAADDQ